MSVSWAHADGGWAYMNADGVTHVGNAPPPSVKRLQWQGFYDCIPLYLGKQQYVPASCAFTAR